MELQAKVRRRRRASAAALRLRALVVALMVCGLTFTTVPAASALTVPQARSYYLARICAPNPAIDRLNWAIFHGRATVRGRQMHGARLRQARRAALAVSRVERAAGLALIHPPSPWPTAASSLAARRVGLALVRDSQLLRQLWTRAGRRFVRFWVRVVLPQGRAVGRLDAVASRALGISPTSGC